MCFGVNVIGEGVAVVVIVVDGSDEMFCIPTIPTPPLKRGVDEGRFVVIPWFVFEKVFGGDDDMIVLEGRVEAFDSVEHEVEIEVEFVHEKRLMQSLRKWCWSVMGVVMKDIAKRL